MAYSIADMSGKAEVAVTERDWKRVEAELDGLVPRGPERDRPGSRQPPTQSDDENALLDHIADALRLDAMR